MRFDSPRPALLLAAATGWRVLRSGENIRVGLKPTCPSPTTVSEKLTSSTKTSPIAMKKNEWINLQFYKKNAIYTFGLGRSLGFWRSLWFDVVLYKPLDQGVIVFCMMKYLVKASRIRNQSCLIFRNFMHEALWSELKFLLKKFRSLHHKRHEAQNITVKVHRTTQAQREELWLSLKGPKV